MSGRILTVFLLLCLSVIHTGCAITSSVEGKPLPDLTFSHISPLPLSVKAVDIVKLYDPAKDANDISSFFPTPPDVAAQRYAENRLMAKGKGGTLRFIIEDSSIHHRYIESDGVVSKMVRLGGLDRYDVAMDIRLYVEYPDGRQSPYSVFKMERYISLPESLSLAEREQEQLHFVELLIRDIDRSITKSLVETQAVLKRRDVSDYITYTMPTASELLAAP